MRSKGMGHIFMNANRNKRSVVLDLKQDSRARGLPGDREERRRAGLQHPAAGDGAAEGFPTRTCARSNPRLIYVGAFGYSQRGPYAAKAAYDDLIQGATGLPWLVEGGRRRDRRATCPPRSPTAPSACTSSTRSAPHCTRREKERHRPARRRADVREPVADGDGRAHGRLHLPAAARPDPGYARMLAKERRPYETKDGYVCVLVYNDKQWRAFFGLIGRPELFADPRYATPEARSRDFAGRERAWSPRR